MIPTTQAKTRVLSYLARRLRDFGRLPSAGLNAIEQLDGDIAEHKRGADLQPLAHVGPHVIISGWACKMRALAEGRRQVFVFLLPGDVIGSFRATPQFDFYSTVALTRLETLDASPLVAGGPDALGRFPDVIEAGVRFEEHAKGLIFDHIVRLGARDAYCGLADLFMEFQARLGYVGQVQQDGAFLLPIGQRVLAQALGVSVVHVNQTLKRLVADGLVEAKSGMIRLLEPARLEALVKLPLSSYEQVGAKAEVSGKDDADQRMEIRLKFG